MLNIDFKILPPSNGYIGIKLNTAIIKFAYIIFVCNLKIIANTIKIKFMSGPASAIMNFFIGIFPFALLSSNVILNPNGIIANFFIFSPRIIPVMAWVISCINVNNMNIAYICICFVSMKIIMNKNISMFMLICILITFFLI